MPELPEIETVKRQLDKKLKGKTIDRVEVLFQRSFQGDPKTANRAKIKDIRRRAKALIIDLANNHSLVIHFKMTGQLVWEPDPPTHRSLGEGGPATSLPLSEVKLRIVGGHPTADWTHSLPSPHTRVIFYLKNGKNTGKLYFNDQRKFGWIKLLPTAQIDQLDFISKLGPEPYAITPAQLYQLTQTSSRPIKLLLMDQQKLSGIGNIYANDALFLAGIDPRRKASQITKPEAQKLHRSIIHVLNDGIKYGGASAADANYVDLGGLGGKYQNHFRVYQRQDQPCPKCHGKIKRIAQSGRSTFFCPNCQK